MTPNDLIPFLQALPEDQKNLPLCIPVEDQLFTIDRMELVKSVPYYDTKGRTVIADHKDGYVIVSC